MKQRLAVLLVPALLLTALVAPASAEGELTPAAAGDLGPAAGPPPIPRYIINLETNDLIYDGQRDELIVSIPGRNPTIGNSVVTINADTGAIGPATFVGSEPGKLALSADGSTLYVGINGAGSVVQLDWATKTITHTMPLGPGYAGPLQAEDIEVAPDNPARVVVSKRDPAISPGFAGLVVFENGIALPNTTPSHTGSSVIEFGATPNRLYGYNHYHTGFEFFRNTVDANGVTQDSVNGGLISGFSTDIEFAGGRIYSSVGQIIDPEARTTVGTLAGSSPAFSIDAALDRAYFLNTVYTSANATLDVFDTTTFRRVGQYSVLGVKSGALTLRRIGPRMLAARTVDFSAATGQVVLIDAGALAEGSGEFTALPPQRILDTRVGLGRLDGVTGPIGEGASIDVQITGRGGVPATGVTAVVMNATAAEPTSSGYMTIWPAGQNRPTISSLNFVAGATVPNLVTVALGSSGRISAFNASGRASLILDVVGFYSSPTGPRGSRFVSVTPARILDTRASQKVGPGETIALRVAGAGGLPASGVTAVAMNVTAVNATATSYLTVYPGDAPQPIASNLNFVAGPPVPNLVVVKVSADGYVRFFNESGSVDVIADTMGYYQVDQASESGRFLSLSPFRLYDSRLDDDGPIRQGETITFGGDSTVFSALVLNVTAVAPAGPGFFTVFPYPGTRPLASNLNFVAGQVVPNAVFVRTDPKFALYNAGGASDLIIDVFGAFT